MRNRRAIFSVLTLSVVSLAFAFVAACKDDPASEFVDPKNDGGNVPDRVQGFLTDTGTPDSGGPIECKPSLPSTFTATYTPPVKKDACTADQIAGYYTACIPNIHEQPCTDWLATNADCGKCIEAPDAKGPVQIFRDRFYFTLNNAGCIGLVQGKTGDDSCSKAFDVATSCRRAACDACFAIPGAQFDDFTDCEELARASSCKEREATSDARCTNLSEADGGAPQCFAPSKDEDPKLVYTRVTSAFCLKP